MKLKRHYMPVTGSRLLRANFKNRHFARNRELHFTGIFQKSAFCPYPRAGFYGHIPKIDILPVTGSCILRAYFKNRRFARTRGLAFTGISPKSTFCP